MRGRGRSNRAHSITVKHEANHRLIRGWCRLNILSGAVFHSRTNDQATLVRHQLGDEIRLMFQFQGSIFYPCAAISVNLRRVVWEATGTSVCVRAEEKCQQSFTWGGSEQMSGNSERMHPKWHPIAYIVHYLWPGPIGLVSKVVHFIGKRVPFGKSCSIEFPTGSMLLALFRITVSLPLQNQSLPNIIRDEYMSHPRLLLQTGLKTLDNP
jgi:hypothetical protein